MHLTQMHQRKILPFYSRVNIHTSKAQACLSTQNNRSLILLLFSILLQHELSYLSDAAEIQDIAEALSYKALLFSSSSTSKITLLFSKLQPSPLSNLPPSYFLSISCTLFYPLYSQNSLPV